MKAFGAISATLALSLVAAASPAAAQVVTNGGFETGDLSGWTVTGNDATAAPTGSYGYVPHSGSYFAGLGDTSGQGSLSQVLTTAAGQSYTLSYYLASKGDQATSFSAMWDGQILAGSELTNPNSNSAYVLYSFVVTGTGSDTLSFHETDVPSWMALDDISVTANVGAVPEPATWAMMLLGFGAIGFAARRKRPHVAAVQAA